MGSHVVFGCDFVSLLVGPSISYDSFWNTLIFKTKHSCKKKINPKINVYICCCCCLLVGETFKKCINCIICSTRLFFHVDFPWNRKNVRDVKLLKINAHTLLKSLINLKNVLKRTTKSHQNVPFLSTVAWLSWF